MFSRYIDLLMHTCLRGSFVAVVSFTVAVFAFVAPAFAQFLPIELRSLSQSGAAIGTTTAVDVVGGDRTDEVDRLHFTHSGITATVQTLDPLPFSQTRLPNYGHFDVTVAADVPAGRYEVRASGRHGVSNPRYFFVSALPNTPPVAISQDATQPTPLSLATLLHGTCAGVSPQYFSLTVADQQSIRIELLAQRLDSRMIGQIQVRDGRGRIIADEHGADGFDPYLVLESLSPGDYLVVINDYLYRSGDEYHYQLLAQDAASSLPVSAPEWGELRTPANPQPIALPHDESWLLSPQHVVSEFEFPANEGDAIGIDVQSQQLGEPTDLRLSVQRVEIDAAGSTVLHDILVADDSRELTDGVLRLRCKDPTAFFIAPATASYRLEIRDLDTGSELSDQKRLRLHVQAVQPRFELIAYTPFPNRDVSQAKPFGSKLFRGGTEAVRVFAIRRDGFTGPIIVTVENLPAGVTAAPVTIAPNQAQNEVVLFAADDASANIGEIQIVGRSDDSTLTASATYEVLNHPRDDQRDSVQSRLTSQLVIGVNDVDTSPISIAWEGPAGVDVKHGGTLSLVAKLTRREGAAAAVVLRPRDLPIGATAAEITIPADQTEGTLQIQIPAAVALGTHTLSVQAETSIKLKPNPQSFDRAQVYRAHLQGLHDDPAHAGDLEAIKAAIPIADQRVEAARATANEQPLTAFIPTPTVTFRVVEP